MNEGSVGTPAPSRTAGESSAASTDVAVGDVAVGDVAVGDVAVGDVAVGDVAVGDVAVGGGCAGAAIAGSAGAGEAVVGRDGAGAGGSAGGAGLSAEPVRGDATSRHHTVLWTSLVAAAAIAVLVAVLASAGKATNGTANSPLVGKPAPPVSGPALDGHGHYTLSQFAGKWVLVNFSASWCVPCRQEMPQLLDFASQSSKFNSTILTVEYDQSDIAALASYLHQKGATWPAVNDSRAKVDYGVGGIPESYLVDPQGIVIEKFIGGIKASRVDAVIARFSPASPSS